MSNALEVSGKSDGLVFRKQTDRVAWRSASPTDLVRGGYTIRRLVIANGTLEALKWLALLLMTGGHVNKYLFNGTLPWLFNAGRVTPGTSSPFTRTFFQEISMQLTIGAHTSAWILAALCSGCASVAVTVYRLGLGLVRSVWNGAPGPQAKPFGRPPPTPAPRAGKSSPPDGLGSRPREAATSPKPLSVLAFLTH